MTAPPKDHIDLLRIRLGLESPPRQVTFDNGSTVAVVRKVVVRGYLGPVSTFRPDELDCVYEMAMGGRWASIETPRGDPAKWDDNPPW